MRVLQINAVYGYGSTGEIARGINLCVKEKGGKIFAAGPDKTVNAPELDGYFPVGTSFDHKFHGLYTRISGKQGYASVRATWKLTKDIMLINPDIIHLHNIHSNYLNLKLFFRFIESEKIKTVITLHDCWFLTGKCCHFAYDDCNRWKEHCGSCPRKNKEVPSLIFDQSSKVLDDKKKWIGENQFVTVVGCSDWVTQIARESILKDRLLGTIHNGIDLEIFEPVESNVREKYNLRKNFVIFGMANKWLSEENMDTFRIFVEALESDETLLLIGCTEEQRRNLPEKVIGVGFITDRKELAMYYSAADIFINVTKVDTLPTVNIESLACGTPVITYKSGGSPEIITEQIGAVVPFGDAIGLIEQKNIFRTADLQSMSNLCREHVQHKFEKKINFNKYVALYEDLIEDRNK